MNITVIGASAGVGLETVIRALERNHNVTTLSRTPIAIPGGSRLIKLQGSATDKAILKESMEEADAVIVTLGTGNSIKSTTLYSDFGKLLVEIHNEHPRDIPFIILTGFGAGDSIHHYPFYMKPVFNFLLKNVYKDKTKLEEIIAASPLKWVVVRPGILKNNSLTEKYTPITDLNESKGIHFINRTDVADYMVKQAENPTHLGKYVAFK